jgi:hypothetical protein
MADIPIDEILTEAFHRPRRFTRIDSFISDDEAKCLTNFNKSELTTLIGHFNLPPEIHVPVPGGMFRYKFHREEIVIYMLVKMKSGSTHTFMSDAVTQGDSRRWSYGYKWIVKYIDDRYFDLIGPRGMEIWAIYFPSFA